MSKAIFLLDEMPVRCGDCPMLFWNGSTTECFFTKHDIDPLSSDFITHLAGEGYPAWCPLKELPGPLIHSETDSEMMSHYKAGWNDLYSTITRKNDYD